MVNKEDKNPFDPIFTKHIRTLAQYNFMNERLNSMFSNVIKQMSGNPRKADFLHVANLMVYDFSVLEEDMFAVDGFGYEGESLISYTENINDEFCKYLFQNSYEVLLHFIETTAYKHYGLKYQLIHEKDKIIRKRFNEQYFDNKLRRSKKYIFNYLKNECRGFSETESNNYSGRSMIDICLAYAEVRNALVHNIDGISQGRFDAESREIKEIISLDFAPGAVNDEGYLPIILDKYKTKNLIGYMSSIMYMVYKTCSIDCGIKGSSVTRSILDHSHIDIKLGHRDS